MDWTRPSLRSACARTYDLLVVGGGVNGCGAAREAASRGLSVLLVEERDFAAGASSRSTKLLHGGLRYLEHGGFALVAEALRERRILCEVLAPHLTRPLPFLVPVYAGDRRSGPWIRLGLTVYDALAWMGGGRLGGHRWLPPAAALAAAPALRPEGLKGVAEYWDCQMDDARLALETLQDAVAMGTVALNDCAAVAAERLEDGDARVRLRDAERGEEATVRAKLVLVAAGPWTDRTLERLGVATPGPLLHPTKGVHLVTRRLIEGRALLVPTRDDGRVFFVIPWDLEGRPASLVGTTDTDYPGDPATARTEAAERDYLLAEASRVLAVPLGREHVWASFAGVRPLAATSADNTSASREHRFHAFDGGLAVTGGKYTTYRSLCRDFVERAAARLKLRLPRSVTALRPLPGAPLAGEPAGADLAETLVRDFGLAAASARCLVSHYGRVAREVAASAAERPALAAALCPGDPSGAVLAMAHHALRREMARHLDDFYLRRTRLGLVLPAGHPGAEAVEALFADALGWDAGRRAAERARLEAALAAEVHPVP